MPSGAYCSGGVIQLVPGALAPERQSCDTYCFVDNVVVAGPEIDAASAVFRVDVTGQGYANTDMCR